MLLPLSTIKEPAIAKIIAHMIGMPSPTDSGLRNIADITSIALKPIYGNESESGKEKKLSKTSVKCFAFSIESGECSTFK